MKYSEKYYFLPHVMTSKAKNWSADLWKLKRLMKKKEIFDWETVRNSKKATT